MAYGVMPRPGSKYGPCKGACAHLDCARNRAFAASPCRICGKVIGYGKPFYVESDTEPRTHIHVACSFEEPDNLTGVQL